MKTLFESLAWQALGLSPEITPVPSRGKAVNALADGFNLLSSANDCSWHELNGHLEPSTSPSSTHDNENWLADTLQNDPPSSPSQEPGQDIQHNEPTHSPQTSPEARPTSNSDRNSESPDIQPISSIAGLISQASLQVSREESHLQLPARSLPDKSKTSSAVSPPVEDDEVALRLTAHSAESSKPNPPQAFPEPEQAHPSPTSFHPRPPESATIDTSQSPFPFGKSTEAAFDLKTQTSSATSGPTKQYLGSQVDGAATQLPCLSVLPQVITDASPTPSQSSFDCPPSNHDSSSAMDNASAASKAAADEHPSMAAPNREFLVPVSQAKHSHAMNTSLPPSELAAPLSGSADSAQSQPAATYIPDPLHESSSESIIAVGHSFEFAERFPSTLQTPHSTQPLVKESTRHSVADSDPIIPTFSFQTSDPAALPVIHSESLPSEPPQPPAKAILPFGTFSANRRDPLQPESRPTPHSQANVETQASTLPQAQPGFTPTLASTPLASEFFATINDANTQPAIESEAPNSQQVHTAKCLPRQTPHAKDETRDVSGRITHSTIPDTVAPYATAQEAPSEPLPGFGTHHVTTALLPDSTANSPTGEAPDSLSTPAPTVQAHPLITNTSIGNPSVDGSLDRVNPSVAETPPEQISLRPYHQPIAPANGEPCDFTPSELTHSPSLQNPTYLRPHAMESDSTLDVANGQLYPPRNAQRPSITPIPAPTALGTDSISDFAQPRPTSLPILQSEPNPRTARATVPETQPIPQSPSTRVETPEVHSYTAIRTTTLPVANATRPSQTLIPENSDSTSALLTSIGNQGSVASTPQFNSPKEQIRSRALSLNHGAIHPQSNRTSPISPDNDDIEYTLRNGEQISLVGNPLESGILERDFSHDSSIASPATVSSPRYLASNSVIAQNPIEVGKEVAASTSPITFATLPESLLGVPSRLPVAIQSPVRRTASSFQNAKDDRLPPTAPSSLGAGNSSPANDPVSVSAHSGATQQHASVPATAILQLSSPNPSTATHPEALSVPPAERTIGILPTGLPSSPEAVKSGGIASLQSKSNTPAPASERPGATPPIPNSSQRAAQKPLKSAVPPDSGHLRQSQLAPPQLSQFTTANFASRASLRRSTFQPEPPPLRIDIGRIEVDRTSLSSPSTQMRQIRPKAKFTLDQYLQLRARRR